MLGLMAAKCVYVHTPPSPFIDHRLVVRKRILVSLFIYDASSLKSARVCVSHIHYTLKPDDNHCTQSLRAKHWGCTNTWTLSVSMTAAISRLSPSCNRGTAGRRTALPITIFSTRSSIANQKKLWTVVPCSSRLRS